MSVQVSALYRRGVVRPLDEDAEQQLQRFFVESSIRCEWLPILDEAQFEAIWNSGLLQAIGEVCGLRFADYEEIMIDSDSIQSAIKATDTNRSDDDGGFRQSLRKLLIEAGSSEMGVLFVL